MTFFITLILAIIRTGNAQFPHSADFLFLLDTSSQMCRYNDALLSRINNFKLQLQSQSIDSRFALATFGGPPQLYYPFGYLDFKIELNCTSFGQEAGLEAIRMSVLLNGTDFIPKCDILNLVDCRISWRSNSSRVIVFLSDEDSDIPTNINYRMNGQDDGLCAVSYDSNNNCYKQWNFEPKFYPISDIKSTTVSLDTDKLVNIFQRFRNSSATLKLDKSFQDEISHTAKRLVQERVSLYLFIKGDKNGNPFQPISSFNYVNSLFNKNDSADNIHTTLLQYGDPLSIDYKSLKSKGLHESLQGQVLNLNGSIRVFEIEDLLIGNSSIDAFFKEIYNAITLSSANLGSGMFSVGSSTAVSNASFHIFSTVFPGSLSKSDSETVKSYSFSSSSKSSSSTGSEILFTSESTKNTTILFESSLTTTSSLTSNFVIESRSVSIKESISSSSEVPATLTSSAISSASIKESLTSDYSLISSSSSRSLNTSSKISTNFNESNPFKNTTSTQESSENTVILANNRTLHLLHSVLVQELYCCSVV